MHYRGPLPEKCIENLINNPRDLDFIQRAFLANSMQERMEREHAVIRAQIVTELSQEFLKELGDGPGYMLLTASRHNCTSHGSYFNPHSHQYINELQTILDELIHGSMVRTRDLNFLEKQILFETGTVSIGEPLMKVLEVIDGPEKDGYEKFLQAAICEINEGWGPKGLNIAEMKFDDSHWEKDAKKPNRWRLLFRPIRQKA